MKRTLLATLAALAVSSPALADDQEFLTLCNNKDNLPEEQKVTLESLIRIAQGVFSPPPEPALTCEQILTELKKTDTLSLRGGTFEYLNTKDLSPIATLDWIRHLNIAGQTSTTDLSALGNLQLESLDIANSGVTSLESLSQFPTLKAVSITKGPYTNLSPLAALPALQTVTLEIHGESDLAIYVGDLQEAPALKKLVIAPGIQGTANQRITGLELLRQLEHLDVDSAVFKATDLTALPLKSLNVRSGHVEQLAAVAALTRLERLSLVSLGVEGIDFVRPLTRLVDLNLAQNKIDSIDALAGLSRLEVLDLSNNRIGFEFVLARLTNLRRLDVSYNFLSSLNITALTKLMVLDARSNALYGLRVDGDVTFPDLEALYLSENAIRSRYLDFLRGARFPALKELDLSSNKIASVEILSSLTSLEKLALDDNKIQDVSPLVTLRRLKSLTAGYNLIVNRVCPVQPESVCNFDNQEI